MSPDSLTGIVHLLSGGLDSVAMLYDLHSQGFKIHCLLFNYGQRHIRELDYARRHCQSLNVPFTVVELHRIKGLFGNSALTDGKGTKIVPNRNACFLHIAASIAEGIGYNMVSIGCNKDDQRDFPDCTKEFLKSINESFERAALNVRAIAPYSGLTKWQIVNRAKEHGWPVNDSMSCYYGRNCGKCDACRQHKEALA